MKVEDIGKILAQDFFSKEDLVRLLAADEAGTKLILDRAYEVKTLNVGRKVYFRGLIEYSNYCTKDCFYCGIRKGNHSFERYELTDEEVLDAAKYAWENKFASIVIQSGERGNGTVSIRRFNWEEVIPPIPVRDRMAEDISGNGFQSAIRESPSIRIRGCESESLLEIGHSETGGIPVGFS